MTDHSSASVRPPKNWQDFEANSRILFECILQDPGVQTNGRPGQRQHGVDIFGRRSGEGDRWIGVQCKGKDANYGAVVTESELRDEVAKTDSFRPALSEFYLITTAPDDTKIQEAARIITDERTKAGRPLSVAVLGWGQLEARISEYPRALRAFAPDSSPYSEQIIANQLNLREVSQTNTALLNEVLVRMEALGKAVPSANEAPAALEAVDQQLNAEIDGYLKLSRGGKPSTALNLLESLRARVWGSATDRIRFKLLTCIASAKLQFSGTRDDEAADDFLEAVKLQPNDSKALANVALAYLLKEDYEKAIDAACSALSADACNADAASYLIQAHIPLDSVNDPFALIAEGLRDNEPVAVAVTQFWRSRGDLRWTESAKTAVKIYPENSFLVQCSAEAVLASALPAAGLSQGEKRSSSIDAADLQAAALSLQQLWDKERGSEAPSKDPSLPLNLRQLYVLLRAPSSASQIVEQACDVIPASVELKKVRANLYLENGETSEAEKLLQDCFEDVEASLLLAELKSHNDPHDALELLDVVRKKHDLDRKQDILVSHLRIGCWLSHPDLSPCERIAKAEDELASVVALHPDCPLVWLMHSIVSEHKGDLTASVDAAYRAKEHLDETSAFHERYLVAKRFEELELHEDAADLLLDRIDLSYDSPPLRTLLSSLINCDRRSQAYSVVSQLPSEVAAQPFFRTMTINLHFRRGDLGAAKTALASLAEQRPADLHVRLCIADIWFRQRDTAAIEGFLEGDVENLEGSPNDYMGLAQLLMRFGFESRALRLGYRVHLENRADASIQLAYFGLLFSPQAENLEELHPDAVGVDTAFTVRNEDGETDTFVIENDSALRVLEETVAPCHSFAVSAAGLSVGDTFEISGDEEWCVTSVKHKYLHALHTRLETFERRFPEAKGFQRVKLKSADGKSSVKPILQEVKARHDADQAVLDAYEQGALPLDVPATYAGLDVIEAWHRLMQSGRQFKACLGSGLERLEARKFIQQNNRKGCVLDVLTLHLVYLLNVYDAVVGICGPLNTTQSAVDKIRARLESVQAHGHKPFMTISWVNGEYVRHEVSAEELQSTQHFYEQELNWIEENVMVVPAEGSTPVPSEAAKIRGLLGSDYLDPVLAADSHSVMLLCEDLWYRQFGKQEFGLGGSWLQPVMMAALEAGLIDQAEYGRVICQLLIAGHGFTSVDKRLLFTALHRTDDEFRAAVNALFSKSADVASHARVMNDFLFDLWSSNKEAYLTLRAATGLILDRLFLGAWRASCGNPNTRDILSLLKPILHRADFRNYVAEWLKGHFL